MCIALSCLLLAAYISVAAVTTSADDVNNIQRDLAAAADRRIIESRYEKVQDPDPNDRYIITFKEGGGGGGKAYSAFNATSAGAGAPTKVHMRFEASNAIVATMPPQVVDELRNNTGVLRVERDSVVRLQHPRHPDMLRGRTSSMGGSGESFLQLRGSRSIRDDSFLRHNGNSSSNPNDNELVGGGSDARRRLEQTVPWGIRMVQANQVVYRGGKTVCIVDSGYDLGHEDLPNLASGQVDGYGGRADMPWEVDLAIHGTFVAGIIAAKNNQLGVVGVAPGVNLYIVRVISDQGGFVFESGVLGAVQHCATAGADVVNLSLGGFGKSNFVREELKKIYDTGILMVAAAGNTGTQKELYPASYHSIISVGAVDKRAQAAFFSTRNKYLELAAPGTSVLSTASFQVVTGTVTIEDGVSAPMAGKSFTGQVAGNVTGPLVDCGIGLTTCANARGKICVIRETRAHFWWKVEESCKLGGGIGAIIYNNARGPCSDRILSSSIPAMCVTKSVGKILKRATRSGLSANVVVTPQSTISEYGIKEGTSFSSAYVSGVAALVWSNHPTCSNVDIRNALRLSALDVGDPGRDDTFGFGIVRAKKAHNLLNRIGC